MDKKFLLALALSISTLMLFHYFNKDAGQSQPASIPTDVRPGQSYKVPTAQDLARPINTEIDFVDKKITQKEEIKTVQTNLCNISFSNYGAVLSSIDFKKHLGKNKIPLRTIHHKGFYEREESMFMLALQDKTPYFYNLVDVKDSQDNIEVSYQTEVDGWLIKKNYVLYKNSYKINLDLVFEPRKKEGSIRPRLFFNTPIIGEIPGDVSSAFVVGVDGKKINKISERELNNAWISPSLFGVEDKYFAHCLVDDANDFVQRAFLKSANKTIFPVLEGPEIKEKTDFNLSFYVGPKLVDDLMMVDDRLEGLLSFGWLSWLCKIFLKFLAYLFSLFKNFGVAIIVFAILLKLPFLPFQVVTRKRMKEYQKYQPTIQRIRMKYRQDARKQQEEIMKFHRDHNLSPATPMIGCLPLLFQMPILFALYRVLDGYLLLYQVPFFGWLTDLSSKDPYYILPILMGLTMVWHQLISPMMDSKQRIAMLFMPVIVTYIFTNLPAGLVLYWLTNNVLMIGEEYIIKGF